MLWLFEGDKSRRKIHLKALLLSSLLPAGGLGPTKLPPKHDKTPTSPLVWSVPRKNTMHKKKIKIGVAKVAFCTSRYKVMLSYYWDPDWKKQREEKSRGSVGASWQIGDAPKGQGTASAGKNGGSCLYAQLCPLSPSIYIPAPSFSPLAAV